jgi:hypothetical protein
MLPYGEFSATIALYRQTADIVYKLQVYQNSPLQVHYLECVGCQPIQDIGCTDAFFTCIG